MEIDSATGAIFGHFISDKNDGAFQLMLEALVQNSGYRKFLVLYQSESGAIVTLDILAVDVDCTVHQLTGFDPSQPPIDYKTPERRAQLDVIGKPLHEVIADGAKCSERPGTTVIRVIPFNGDHVAKTAATLLSLPKWAE